MGSGGGVPCYSHSSTQSPASQVPGAPPPALPAPGDPMLGTTAAALLGHSLEPVPGEHPQMVGSACPLCPLSPRPALPGHRTGSRGGGGSPHLPSSTHCVGDIELARCLAWAGQPSASQTGCAAGTAKPFAPRGERTGLGSPKFATWKSNVVSRSSREHWRGLGESPRLGSQVITGPAATAKK